MSTANTLDRRRTEGRVEGSASLREFVHYCDLQNHPGDLYVVVDYDYATAEGFNSEGAIWPPDGYVLRNVKTGETKTDRLTAPGWTFHPVPDLVVAVTTDHLGNHHTWHMDALPGFCDAAMIERRARKRHFVFFDVPGVLDHYYWTSKLR